LCQLLNEPWEHHPAQGESPGEARETAALPAAEREEATIRAMESLIPSALALETTPAAAKGRQRKEPATDSGTTQRRRRRSGEVQQPDETLSSEEQPLPETAAVESVAETGTADIVVAEIDTVEVTTTAGPEGAAEPATAAVEEEIADWRQFIRNELGKKNIVAAGGLNWAEKPKQLPKPADKAHDAEAAVVAAVGSATAAEEVAQEPAAHATAAKADLTAEPAVAASGLPSAAAITTPEPALVAVTEQAPHSIAEHAAVLSPLLAPVPEAPILVSLPPPSAAPAAPTASRAGYGRRRGTKRKTVGTTNSGSRSRAGAKRRTKNGPKVAAGRRPLRRGIKKSTVKAGKRKGRKPGSHAKGA